MLLPAFSYAVIPSKQSQSGDISDNCSPHNESERCSKGSRSRLIGNKLQHLITSSLFLPQSSRSPTKPMCSTPCAPLPTMTLSCASTGGATGDMLALLSAPELRPRVAKPSDELPRVRNTTGRRTRCSSATTTCLGSCVYPLITVWSSVESG